MRNDAGNCATAIVTKNISKMEALIFFMIIF